MAFDFPRVLVRGFARCVVLKLIVAGSISNLPSHKDNCGFKYREHVICQTADAYYEEFMSIGGVPVQE
jgi:hypothetical protein